MNKIMRTGLLLLIILVPMIFLTNTTRNPFLIQKTILQVFISSIIAIWMSMIQRTALLRNPSSLHKVLIGCTPLDMPIGAFFIAVAVSILLSLIYNSTMKSAVFFMASDGFLFLLLNCASVYYITVYTVKDRRFMKILLNCLLAVGAVVSVYGILQFYGIEFIWPYAIHAFQGRSVSTFGNPNFLASFLVLILPLGLMRCISASKKYEKIIIALLCGIFIACLLCTSTRSAWLGFAVSVIITGCLLIYTGRMTVLKYFIGLLCAVFLLGTVFFISSDRKNIVIQRAVSSVDIDTSSQSYKQRILIWKVSRDMFFSSPVFGKGWGTFELFYPSYQAKYLSDGRYSSLRTHGNAAHNEILQILSETGLVGLSISLWFLYAISNYVMNIIKKLTLHESGAQLTVIGLSAGAAGMLVDNLLNVSLHFPAPALIFWLYIGLIIAVGRIFQNESEITGDIHKYGDAFYRTASVLIVFGYIVIGFIIVLNINRFVAETHQFNGQRSIDVYNLPEKGVSEYKKAYALLPWDVHTNYNLANAFVKVGRSDEAVQMYYQAILVNPGYDEIYYNLGIVLMQKRFFKEAVNAFKEVIRLNPTNAEAYALLADAYIGSGDSSSGMKYLKEAEAEYMKMYDKSGQGTIEKHLNLGNIYFKLGEINKASAEYRQVIKLDPMNKSARLNIVSALLKKGSVQQAREELREILKLDPDNAFAREKLRQLQ